MTLTSEPEEIEAYIVDSAEYRRELAGPGGQPPTVLYHYTTASGALGIVQSRSIWATSTRFLNDSSEYSIGFDIARRILEQDRSLDATYLKQSLMFLYSYKDWFVCVASFSEDGDLLSQWRAYSNAGGFALGFAAEHLARSPESGAYLARCIYEPEQHERITRGAVEHHLEEYRKVESQYEGNALAELQINFARELARTVGVVSALFKHPSFMDESEWRVIVEGSHYPSLRFRPAESSIVPYLELPFDATALGKFVTAPSAPRDAEKSLMVLLQAEGWTDWEIRNSVSTYRP